MIYACQKHGKNKTLTFSDASTPSNANSSLFPLLSEKEKKNIIHLADKPKEVTSTKQDGRLTVKQHHDTPVRYCLKFSFVSLLES